jgi:phosphate transport system substrate-binding protein
VALLGVVHVLASCGARAAGRERVVVTGSSTVAPLFAEIAKRFEARAAGVRVEVQTGGSSRGIADVRRGTADIGMVSRNLAADEADLVATPIAQDGLAVIVHRDNPVASLSQAQVRAIYRGEIDNWSAVGGPDLPILVVHKADGRATQVLFLENFGLKNPEVHPDTIVGDNAQGLKMVAGHAGAIGYVSIGAAATHAKRDGTIRMLPHDGLAASLDAVARGLWPMRRPLHLVTRGRPVTEGRLVTGGRPVTRGRPAQRVTALIEFARSPAVHDLIRSLGFVPVAR